MSERPDEPGTEQGWRVVDAAIHSARERLGDGLLSAYAIGSLAHGGFSAAVSDVDLALLTDGRRRLLIGRVIAGVLRDVRASALPLGDRLSVFHAPWPRFAAPPRTARFPPIDRYDLMHYGILAHGADLRDAYGVTPAPRQIRAQAVDSALQRVTRTQLETELRELAAGGMSVHDATKLVLWPVRLQHVVDTGRATGNAAAVEHYRQLPGTRHRSLVGDALAWRDRGSIPDPATALRRITEELDDLHVEVFTRVGERPDVPRRGELVQRASALAAHGCNRLRMMPRSPDGEELG